MSKRDEAKPTPDVEWSIPIDKGLPMAEVFQYLAEYMAKRGGIPPQEETLEAVTRIAYAHDIDPKLLAARLMAVLDLVDPNKIDSPGDLEKAHADRKRTLS
jgi:hypothetical protein